VLLAADSNALTVLLAADSNALTVLLAADSNALTVLLAADSNVLTVHLAVDKYLQHILKSTVTRHAVDSNKLPVSFSLQRKAFAPSTAGLRASLAIDMDRQHPQ
jgi:hypothetical protein